jgi:hypothetical protein
MMAWSFFCLAKFKPRSIPNTLMTVAGLAELVEASEMTVT